jgi:hypothetical protein
LFLFFVSKLSPGFIKVDLHKYSIKSCLTFSPGGSLKYIFNNSYKLLIEKNFGWIYFYRELSNSSRASDLLNSETARNYWAMPNVEFPMFLLIFSIILLWYSVSFKPFFADSATNLMFLITWYIGMWSSSRNLWKAKSLLFGI